MKTPKRNGKKSGPSKVNPTPEGCGLAGAICSDDLLECLAHHDRLASVLLAHATEAREKIEEMDREPLLRPDFACTWEETKAHNLKSAEWDANQGMMHHRFAASIRGLFPPNDQKHERCPTCGDPVTTIFDHVDGCPNDSPNRD